MLSLSEKDDLLIIIRGIYGHNNFAEPFKNSFNEQTAEKVREALNDAIECNDHIKTFIISIIGSASIGKGQFRKALNKIAKAMSNDKVRFNGMLCNSIKGWRRSLIQETFYY